MASVSEALDLEPLGIRVEFLSGEGEDALEMDVIGRPRGFFNQRHVHASQVERLEVLSGALKVTLNGAEHVLRQGQSIEIPAGTPHTQVPLGKEPGRVRIQVRPAGQTRAFLEYVAELARDGKFMRSGFPRPVAAADLILRFSEAGHASAPPLEVQRAFARLVMAIANLSRPYLFVDEWNVGAPLEPVFDAVADSRTYPVWWRPVYLDVDADAPPGLGATSRHHFKGRLPYHLHTTSVISEFDPPQRVTADVEGDLRGRGTWTLTPTAQGTHVRFDWHVHADRKLLRVLTPVLRPLLRWNHNWAIARAQEGLEPYAQGQAAGVDGAK